MSDSPLLNIAPLCSPFRSSTGQEESAAVGYIVKKNNQWLRLLRHKNLVLERLSPDRFSSISKAAISIEDSSGNMDMVQGQNPL